MDWNAFEALQLLELTLRSELQIGSAVLLSSIAMMKPSILLVLQVAKLI